MASFLDYPCSNCGALVATGQTHGCMNTSGSKGAQANASAVLSQVDPSTVAEAATEVTSDAKTKNFRGVPLIAQGAGNTSSP